ncbi:MAG TPA: glycoside hydrolase family 71/99-like protein, partial [Candidatus Acidoferrum sp.]|nr:glycoside hydrolase family 71/99-like protein [Candidatus Acidoferrum sp.]
FLAASSSAAPKPLLVYYQTWFVARPYSDHWGWHWTMNHFDPDQVDASGQRQIASWYHPLIGPYDSADPAVLEYHVLLMKLAGIDGLIADWYGPDDYLDYAVNHARTRAIFEQARKSGLQFALCYEDQTLAQQVQGGFVASSNALAHAQQTLRYAEGAFFGDPAYLRQAHRPVLLNFGPQYFKESAQWEAIFAVLQASNRPAFFTEDNRLPAGLGAFNWPPMWMSIAPGTRGVLSSAALQDYLSQFEEKGSTWPAYISSAFPRFHDIYQSAGARDYWGYLGDNKGRTFRQTLGHALTNSSTMAMVVTWNDFGEGTMIEPTVEYGFRDLGIVQEHRRLYLDPKFAGTTNDLALPLRLYRLRKNGAPDADRVRQLDTISANLSKGDLPAARRLLDTLESSRLP